MMKSKTIEIEYILVGISCVSFLICFFNSIIFDIVCNQKPEISLVKKFFGSEYAKERTSIRYSLSSPIGILQLQ